MAIGRQRGGGAVGRRARRAVAALVTLVTVLSATPGRAAGPRAVFQAEKAGFSAVIEDMTAADVVKEMGKRFGFRVIDRTSGGPKLTRSLRGPSLAGLLAQLLPAGGYVVTYRGAGPPGPEVIDAVLLVSTTTTRTPAAEGPRLPSSSPTSVAPAEAVGAVVPPRPPDVTVPPPFVPRTVPGQDAVDTAGRAPSSPTWDPAAVTPPTRPAPAARGGVAAPATPPSLTPQAGGTPEAGGPVVSEEVRRFISDRVDVLIDAARDATLSTPRPR